MADDIRYYGTGHRKNAIARVWLIPGSGRISVNGKELEDYFGRFELVTDVQAPLRLTETLDQYDVKATAKGGGPSGQAGALRHGIARALLGVNDEFRIPLKQAGFLTRDPRMKERKHAGFRSARRGKQFSKR